MKKSLKQKIITKMIILALIINFFSFMTIKSQAKDSNNLNSIIGYITEESKTRSIDDVKNSIVNHAFYIKNAYTGQYMDVQGGNVGNGINVSQYIYNGGANQRWFIKSNGDSTFSLYSDLGRDYVLDINGGIGNDLTNVQIWTYNGSDAQKFRIGFTGTSTYAFLSKSSDYKKAIVTHGGGCNTGENINQYTYSGKWNELWILEPVAKDVNLGVEYAIDNFDKTVPAYPRFSISYGGDCTNFVSQCLLAEGIHYRDRWMIYRKNGNYTDINNVNELNNSWLLSDPSPWISAKQFKEFWAPKVSGAYKATGKQILEDPSIAWNIPIGKGCVIQRAENVLGVLGTVKHSMFITDYTVDGGNNTYVLTYHSQDTKSMSLLEFCRREPNSYFLFYIF